ncbi:DUF1501 domain-containing protein [bacterium]|nr:DUF1501 domain-containing protein [bacterium]
MLLHRRDAMLQLGSVAGSALTLPALLQGTRTAAAANKSSAKSCIFLFMWGGQPQQDMWDLKPDAPEGVRSPFQPISTTVPGLFLGDQMPGIARHADKLSIIRTLNHTATDHGVSVYHALTGRAMLPPRTFPGNDRRRTDFPSIGSMFSYLGGESPLPTSFSIPRPVAHDGVMYSGTHAGFLGSKHDPVELGKVYNHVEVGPRADADLATIPLNRPDAVSATRFQARRSLLDILESQDRAMQKSPRTNAYGGVREDAYRLLQSTSVREALNLELESPALRDLYGRNEYGESFLTARRLVEAGVRLITVNWMFITPAAKVYNVWDAHGGLTDLEHGATGYGMLKANYCLPAFDQAFSALMTDLSQSGLLEDTVVACIGEFGRTPQINGANGRDHWPFCYSGVLAGGGIVGGSTYGTSDKIAAYVKENPVSPGDYLATLCQACGLDPHSEVHDLQGRPFAICDGQPIDSILS